MSHRRNVLGKGKKAQVDAIDEAETEKERPSINAKVPNERNYKCETLDRFGN